MRIGHGATQCKGDRWPLIVREPHDWTVIDVDLTSATWIDCGFLARLGAVLHAAVDDFVPVVFRSQEPRPPGFRPGILLDTPSKSGPVPYASRMGLRKLLDELGIAHDLPTTGANPSTRFVELCRFGPGRAVDDVIEVVYANVLDWGDDALAEQLWGAFYELALNIEEHAGRSGYVMAQWFAGRATPTLELSVADAGRGIRASLNSGGHAYDNDAEAVIDATTTRRTSKSKDGGFGIMTVRKAITGQLGGRFTIGSGDALVYCSGTSERARRVSPWSGTVIDASFTWKPRI